MQQNKIESIQALRGIAALMVLLSHYMFFVTAPGQAEVARFLFLSGGAGVDLFFVIAGFVLVHSTSASDGTAGYALGFVGRRLLRIWPAYIAATLLFIFLVPGPAWFLEPGRPAQLLRSLFFIPLAPTDSPFFGYATLEVGWTLNYEMYFYGISAVFMLFGRWRWSLFFLWVLATVVALPLYLEVFSLNVKTPYGLSAYVGMLTNSIILDFVAGVAIGLLYHSRIQSPPRWVIAAFIAVGSMFLAIQFWGRVQAGHGMARYGFSSALIILGVALAHKERMNLHVPRPLVWLGGISYSLYLFHTTVNALLHQVAAALGLQAWTMGFSMLIFSTAVSILASYGFYRIFEVALPNKLHRLSAHRKVRVAARA
ncbi:acyltransferase family protein [Bordetella genomosp. 2]|uniref:Acyltransferase 3 domain-containing protein n=1 Tax=Bordetella genomosp. 2 TaxID=1983456 RepID=A0A261W1M1_9BORD|nr:acyltransferase [Bordetella genomosp. 2]OZI79931.1 hypothetical protein CAL24_08465 [Bordetella genomosp. 2]